MDTIAAYLIFLNLVGFLIMGEDKRRAKMHRWRISERMLFLVSILILILQIAGAIWLYRQGLYHL